MSCQFWGNHDEERLRLMPRALGRNGLCALEPAREDREDRSRKGGPIASVIAGGGSSLIPSSHVAGPVCVTPLLLVQFIPSG